MKTFIRIYYRLKYGEQFQERLYNANLLGDYINEQSGNHFNLTYNSDGEQIRGWHKPTYKFTPQHPLITKYQ